MKDKIITTNKYPWCVVLVVLDSKDVGLVTSVGFFDINFRMLRYNR